MKRVFTCSIGKLAGVILLLPAVYEHECGRAGGDPRLSALAWWRSLLDLSQTSAKRRALQFPDWMSKGRLENNNRSQLG